MKTLTVILDGTPYRLGPEHFAQIWSKLSSKARKELAAVLPSPRAKGRSAQYTHDQRDRVLHARKQGRTFDWIANDTGLSRSQVVRICEKGE